MPLDSLWTISICRRCTLVGEQPSWLSLPKRADRSCYRNEAYRKVTGPYLLVEDRLGLTTITGLLAVVTTLSLSRQRILTLLVLGNFVGAILTDILSLKY